MIISRPKAANEMPTTKKEKQKRQQTEFQTHTHIHVQTPVTIVC